MESQQPQGLSYSDHVVFFISLLLGMLLGMLLGNGLIIGIGMAGGMDLQQLSGQQGGVSDDRFRFFLRWSNAVAHLCTFTLPALTLGFLFYRRQMWRGLALHRAPSMVQLPLSLLLILASFPLTQLTYWLNRQLPLPQWVMDMEDSATTLIESVMQMNSPAELLLNLLVIAVLPAVGEELIFRGLIQKRLQRLFTNPHLAVWVTAIIFSAIHLQFAGFLPRLLLGALLGYLFLWTRNLWIPVAVHFFFNGAQVAAQYFMGGEVDPTEAEQMNAPLLISGLVSLLAVLGIARFFPRSPYQPEEEQSDG